MQRTNLLFLFSVLTLLPGCTGGQEDAIEKSTQLQRSGVPDEALQGLLEARVEAPESMELLFAIAGAEAALGDHLLGQHDLEGARSRFTGARETYERCAIAPQLAEGAVYNAATCLLRLDEVLERQKNYVGRVENLKAAVTALDTVVGSYPDQARAKKNLDYARYQLALLLQSPPKAPEKEEEQEPEDDTKPVTGVAGATTQLPGATVEVEAGSVGRIAHEAPRGGYAMNRIAMLLGILSLIGQEPTTPAVPATPEVVRVLTIQARQIDGAARYLDPSLAPVQSLLEQVPGNHFKEIGFQEVKVDYGKEGSLDLGEGGYTLWFAPSEFTEAGEVVFECHIDLKDGDKTVEALRVNGKLAPGKGTAFCGLPLNEGEMMVVMSIAREEEKSETSESGGSGDESKGSGDGSASARGQEGYSNGPDGVGAEKKKETRVPELESREPVPPPVRPEVPTISGEVKKSETRLPEDMSTIEGILRALEEQDMLEQKSSRNRRYDVVIRGDWW